MACDKCKCDTLTEEQKSKLNKVKSKQYNVQSKSDRKPT